MKKTKKQDFSHIELTDIPLGYRVRDRVSGFEGIVTSRTVFMNGCIQYQIKPGLDKEGKPKDSALCDCQQLEIVDRGIAPKENKPKKLTGGDMPDAPNFGIGL